MNKVKQSFILSFVLIFVLTSITVTASGLHIINSFNKSKEIDLDSSKKVETIKVRDNIEVEIYTELPSVEKFTDEEATIIYPEEIYEVVYYDIEGNIVTSDKITPDTAASVARIYFELSEIFLSRVGSTIQITFPISYHLSKGSS